ncbi:MAG: VTT domain-containing protein [Defluviitaleaceae bacterium]|nr:VTT domain-containing protein [Defluviitaleaceae bacterium]
MNVVAWIVDFAQVSGGFIILIFMGLYLLKPFFMFIPLPALYMAAGLVFSIWMAIFMTVGGLFLALTSGYYLGKWLGQQKVNDYLAKHEKVHFFLEGCNKRFSSFCFIYRMLPLPFDLFNIACGASKAPFWQYVIVSLLGLSVAMMPYILVGTYVTTPLSLAFLLPFGVSLAFSGCLFIWYQKKIGDRFDAPRVGERRD